MIAGGVLGGVGKGVTTSSIGKILQNYGYKTTAVKIDPYINCDAGTLRPTEHGEVWVTDDGGEIDVDCQDAYDPGTALPYVTLGCDYASVDSAVVPACWGTGPANITFNCVDCNKFRIYYNPTNKLYDSSLDVQTYSDTGIIVGDQDNIGGDCAYDGTDNSGICTDVECSDNILTFRVLSFSGYSSTNTTNLTIYDEDDGATYACDQEIQFYANYTETDGTHIPGANCTITYWDLTSEPMQDNGVNYNATNTLPSSTGTYEWNVTCYKAGFDKLNTTDDVYAFCGEPPQPIPEFSIIGAILVVIAAIMGVVVLKKRQ